MKQQEEIFLQAKQFLMEPEIWTFGNMLGYQRKARNPSYAREKADVSRIRQLLELLGANSWRRRLSETDPNIEYLEKELLKGRFVTFPRPKRGRKGPPRSSLAIPRPFGAFKSRS